MYHPRHAKRFYRVDHNKLDEWITETMQWLPGAVLCGLMFAVLVYAGLIM